MSKEAKEYIDKTIIIDYNNELWTKDGKPITIEFLLTDYSNQQNAEQLEEIKHLREAASRQFEKAERLKEELTAEENRLTTEIDNRNKLESELKEAKELIELGRRLIEMAELGQFGSNGWECDTTLYIEKQQQLNNKEQ